MPKERKKKKVPYTYYAAWVAAYEVLEEKEELDKESWAEKWWSLILNKRTLDQYRQSFDETNNPLYIWEAYRLCRHFDKPWPDYVVEYMNWIMEYLDGVANGLLNNKGNKPSDCALHLGFELKDGGPSQFRQYETARNMEYIVGEVINFLNMDKKASLEDAYHEISKNFKEIHKEPISEAAIKDWYLKKK